MKAVLLEVERCVVCRRDLGVDGYEAGGHYRMCAFGAGEVESAEVGVLAVWHERCGKPSGDTVRGCRGKWKPWMGLRQPREGYGKR